MGIAELIELFEKTYPEWEWLVRTNKDLRTPTNDVDNTFRTEPCAFYVCLNKHGIRVKAYGPTAAQTFSEAMTLLPERKGEI